MHGVSTRRGGAHSCGSSFSRPPRFSHSAGFEWQPKARLSEAPRACIPATLLPATPPGATGKQPLHVPDKSVASGNWPRLIALEASYPLVMLAPLIFPAESVMKLAKTYTSVSIVVTLMTTAAIILVMCIAAPVIRSAAFPPPVTPPAARQE